MEGCTAGIHIGYAARESKLRQSRGEFSPPGKEQAVFLLCSHYDTKLFDSIRFVGANDGGSSTGALIEMARVLALHPSLAAKTLLVFFDGEEAYENFTDTDGLYGSRYFAAHLPRPKTKFVEACCWTWWATAPSRSLFHRIRRRK